MIRTLRLTAKGRAVINTLRPGTITSVPVYYVETPVDRIFAAVNLETGEEGLILTHAHAAPPQPV